MARQIPVTRLSPSLLPVEVEPRSGAVERALRLARTDPRQQIYSISELVVGSQAAQDFARLLSSYRRRLDGVGSVTIEAWHESPDGVHLVVHQAQERQQ